MRRNESVTISALAIGAIFASLVGCKDPAREQAKVDQAQREATATAEQARQDAVEKIDNARQEVRQAQANVDDALTKARAEYRDKTRDELNLQRPL